MIRLLPKETRFFELFQAQTAKVFDAVRALHELA